MSDFDGILTQFALQKSLAHLLKGVTEQLLASKNMALVSLLACGFSLYSWALYSVEVGRETC